MVFLFMRTVMVVVMVSVMVSMVVIVMVMVKITMRPGEASGKQQKGAMPPFSSSSRGG